MIKDEEVYAYLEHWGVKGMKWGIRNDKEKKARREAKAQKHQGRADKLQARIDKNSWWEDPEGLRKARDREQKNVKRAREGKLTSGQRKAIIGASAAAAIIAAYAGYQTLQSGNGRRLISKGKDFITRNDVPFKKSPYLAKPDLDVDEIHELVVKPINPDYGAIGTKMNCRRATYAYEMRRRGYDVAATRTSSGRGQDITGIYNVTHPYANLVPPGKTGILSRYLSEAPKDHKPFTELITTPGAPLGDFVYSGDAVRGGAIIRALAGTPDGARGELSVEWASGGLHSIAWEKIKGQVVVFDNQTGQRYTGTALNDLMQQLNQAGITRLDDKPLNTDFLRRWLKNAA